MVTLKHPSTILPGPHDHPGDLQEAWEAGPRPPPFGGLAEDSERTTTAGAPAVEPTQLVEKRVSSEGRRRGPSSIP